MLEYFGQLFISGQRAVKIVKPDHNDQLSWIYTYYIYDATGNVMATYTRRNYFDDIGDSSFAFVNDWIYNELGLTDLQDFMESKFSYNGQFMNDWIEYLSTNELAAGVFDEFSPDDFLGWDATLVPAVLSNFAHSPNASPTENDALLNAILSNQQSNFVSSVLNSGIAVLNNALTAILSNDPTDLLLNCMATNNPVGLNSVYVSLGGSPVPPPTNASRIAYIRSFPPPTIASQISAIESISNLQNYFSSCLNSTMIYNSWNSSQPNIAFTDLFDAWSGLGDTSLILDVLQNHYSNDAHLRILLKEVKTLQQLYQLASSSNYSSFVSNSINATSYHDLSFVMYQSSALTFSSYLKQVRTHFGTTNYSNMMADIGEWLKFGKDILLQEQHIYGSTRLGMYQSNQLLVKYKYKYSDTLQIYLDSVKFDRVTNRAMRKLSHKQYELTNHLGNVLSTVLDRKTPITLSGGSTTITHFEGDVVFASDYYPFGSPMSWTTSDSSGGRLYSGGGYRYGFNGFEKDSEIAGIGKYLTFNDFGYDPIIGRRWTVDKHIIRYPSISPFASFNNNPIIYTDPDGKDAKVVIDANSKTITISTKIVLWGADATKQAVTSFQNELNGTWNSSNFTYTDKVNNETYTVKFDIQVELAGGIEKTESIPLGAYNPFDINNYIEVDNAKLANEYNEFGRKVAAYTLDGDEGLFGTSYAKALPHEVGHLLGLDHYYDQKTGRDTKGWENNVMGALDGKDGTTGAGNVDQRNVNSILSQFMPLYENARATNKGFNQVGIKSRVPGTDYKYETKIDNSNSDVK